jgi:2-polyprenyl-3-methyl-5-hydroxy-6-metoxy-1,4-benzoquinol methylase
MARFGASQIYDPKVRENSLAKLFLKVFGTIATSSSHFHFMRIVKKVDEEINLGHVLDAGCGKGLFSFWLAQRYRNARIYACDFSEAKIDVCEDIKKNMNIHNINFFTQDLRTYRSEDSYDFIFSNHVLEHIIENRLVISNLVHSLRKGGYIYIQMPNAVQRRLPFGKRFLKSYEEWEKEEHIGQTLTLDSLSSELSSLGCKILVAKHTEGFVGELGFELGEMALSYFRSNVLFALLYPLLKILGYVDSLINYSYGNGILVLAKKDEDER